MPRLFHAGNSAGATVHDVEAKRKLEMIMSVDIGTGEVTVAHQPLRLIGDEVATYTKRYQSIYPIYGGKLAPVLFHCYGRQA